MLWVYYCLMEDKIAIEYEYMFRQSNSGNVIVDYNSWPQFKKRPE